MEDCLVVWKTTFIHTLELVLKQEGSGQGTNFKRMTSPGGSVQFSSVTQSCPTPCDCMDCSTPGLPVYHQLSELTQTHVHLVGDAIQPSHLCCPFLPPSIFPSIRVFTSESTLRMRWTKYWEFQLQYQSFQ